MCSATYAGCLSCVFNEVLESSDPVPSPRPQSLTGRLKENLEKMTEERDHRGNGENREKEQNKRVQRQMRDIKEEMAELSKKEAEASRKKHELVRKSVQSTFWGGRRQAFWGDGH